MELRRGQRHSTNQERELELEGRDERCIEETLNKFMTCSKERLNSLENLDPKKTVFFTKLRKRLQPQREVDHRIETVQGAKPPLRFQY